MTDAQPTVSPSRRPASSLCGRREWSASARSAERTDGREPALAVDQLCANCQTSAKRYGMNELEGIGTACTDHVKYAELKRPELLPAQHMQAKLEAERSMGEKEVEHVQYCGTCWQGKNQCRGLAAARAKDQAGLEPITGRAKTK